MIEFEALAMKANIDKLYVIFLLKKNVAIHEILANKAFIVTSGLISQLFVVAFIHPTYV